MSLFTSAFPDIQVEVLRYVEQDDVVTALIRITGTHEADFMEIPASGHRIDILAFDLCRFRDGKIVEHWGVTDALTMMQQLGVVPAPD